MDMIVRGVAIYITVWLILRLSGKRTFSEMTTFDFVLLLICGEATQQALLGEDFSVTNAVVVIVTLATIDRFLSIAHARWPAFERLMEGRPVLVFANGARLEGSMKAERVDIEDILQEARRTHGIDSIERVRHVVLENSGGLSVIPTTDPNSSPNVTESYTGTTRT